jgi:steroid delta-isomerase-like uncharacterized protein
MAQATAASPQALIDAAKATVLGYNEKDWNKVRNILAPDFVYDEVGTQRKLQGVDQTIAAYQGWAKAFPDSKGTINSAFASGNTVVLEVTWKGTHTGPLETAKGSVAATGKPMQVRACVVFEMAGEKAKVQRHYFDMATLLGQLGVAG